MLQKLALAVKTKTIEFFAEEEEEDDRSSIAELCLLDSNEEEVITGQRVVVIKPDQPNATASSSHPQSRRLYLHSLASSLFATLSAFHAAYLQLQTAQDPFDRAAIEAADSSAVSHLRRLSELKKALLEQPKNNPNRTALPSELEARVLENQSLLRKYETAFNRLQSDVDCKDTEVSALRQQLKEVQCSVSLLKRRERERNRGGAYDLRGRERAFLTLGVFDSLLKECCRMVHRFAKVLVGLMKDSGWDLELAANSIHPNVDYAKRGHCKYAILSYICLAMFDGFGSSDSGDGCDGFCACEDVELESSGKNLASRLIRQLTVDAVELLDVEPDGEFARFCARKYGRLIHPKMRDSLVGNLDWRDCPNPLYEPFVLMSNAVWMLHKLALAFDQPVEIFRVARGVDFSIVYMDSVIRSKGLMGSRCAERSRTVGFTVIPGFYVGRMVIQCKVYLDCTKCPI